MFWRILSRLLRANPARLATVLLALAAGAGVTAALLNLRIDAERRLRSEFRNFGANVVISPAAAQPGAAPVLPESLLKEIPSEFQGTPIAAVPFLYLVAEISAASGKMPVVSAVVAGTHLDDLARVGPGWKLDLSPSANLSEQSCILGAKVSAQLGLRPGESLELRNPANPERYRCSIAGTLSAGGPEDNEIFAPLPLVQRLAGRPAGLSLIQVSLAGSPQQVTEFIKTAAASLRGVSVRGVRQFGEVEARLFGKIRGLLTATVALILVLTGLCVMASMSNAAVERKQDVGLMKAIGGQVSRILRLFLVEAAILGLAAGVLGSAAGLALSIWLGRAVFGVAAQPRLIVYLVTVVLTVLVAVAGSFPLRRLAGIKPAVIFRGEA